MINLTIKYANRSRFSGGSKITRRGGGMAWTSQGGGMDFSGGYVSKILYVKRKNLDPWGGVHRARPLDPPMRLIMVLLFWVLGLQAHSFKSYSQCLSII